MKAVNYGMISNGLADAQFPFINATLHLWQSPFLWPSFAPPPPIPNSLISLKNP